MKLSTLPEVPSLESAIVGDEYTIVQVYISMISFG
jgi:hypothetical protein